MSKFTIGFRGHAPQQVAATPDTSNAPKVSKGVAAKSSTCIAAAAHPILGKLTQRAQQAGERVAKANRKGLDATNAELKPAMAGGYEIWAAGNAIAASTGIVKLTSGSDAVTTTLSSATNGIGMLPQGLEIASTAVAFADASLVLADASKKERAADPGTLTGKDASSAHKQAKGNFVRAIPAAIRNLGVGSVNQGGRIFTADNPGHSMYGDKLAAVHGDGIVAIASGVTYVVGGALQSAKVDRGVDRAQAVRASVLQPVSSRTDSASAAMQQLDDAFATGRFSPNVYAILRTRGDAQVQQFLDNFAALAPGDQKHLEKLLHFGGEQIAMKVLNMGRTTNLNTASMRRSAREEVIDAFIEAQVANGDATALLGQLKQVRKEALGAKLAPDVAALERSLSEAGIEPGELSSNVLKAVVESGHSAAFVARYGALSQEHRTRLQATLHFGSWRFWKADATLPTTKYQRSDIRAALIKQFASGASFDGLDTMKLRYNQKVLPLQTGRTHAREAPADTMRVHILASQDSTLDSLKEEKQNAKVQIAYGTLNTAVGIAELAVNPAAAAGVSAARAVLSPLYYAYAGRRGLVGEINRRNAQPVDAVMHEEALLNALPQVRELIAAGGAQTGRLRAAQRYMREELGLNEVEIRRVQTLELAGHGAEARVLLARKNPEANVLIALRVLAEQSTATGSELQRHALGFIATAAAASASDALKAINPLSDPDQTYASLKQYFIEHAAYNPSAGIDALAQQLSAGTAVADYGFDKTLYQGKAPQDIAQDLKQRFAGDNSLFATRLFISDLFSPGAPAVAARNMLRDFRFSETEIDQLQAMNKKSALAWLDGHLFGENLRRRFSTRPLDQHGRDQAAAVVDHMPTHHANQDEPLTWRRNLEQLGVSVIDNAGTPGLDSMLHALYQNCSGKTDASSSTMQRQVMEARRRVLAEVTAAAPGSWVEVTQHREAIVRIAAQVFGKPGATVKIVSSSGQEGAHRVGPARDEQAAPLAAVLCYDEQTRRTFALHGGDPLKVSAQAPRLELEPFDDAAFERDTFAAMGLAPERAPIA
jgi:hypothetical protein